jgi:hypothetical protein
MRRNTRSSSMRKDAVVSYIKVRITWFRQNARKLNINIEIAPSTHHWSGKLANHGKGEKANEFRRSDDGRKWTPKVGLRSGAGRFQNMPSAPARSGSMIAHSSGSIACDYSALRSCAMGLRQTGRGAWDHHWDFTPHLTTTPT